MLMTFLKNTYLFLILCILTACSSISVQQLPKQDVEQRLFKVEQIQPKQETSLLAVQFSTEQWRWVQTDPLGAPIARLLLTKQGWQNDGFVMPNRQSEQLFSALANGLNPTNPLFILGNDYQIKKTSDFLIYLPDKSEWKVNELAQ